MGYVRSTRWRSACGGPAIAVALLLTPWAGRAAEDATSALRPVMQRVFDAIALLLPASLDEHAFEDPLAREGLQRQLRALAAASAEVQSHVEKRDISFRHLGRSLATDVDLAVERFEAGEYIAAASQLGGVLQNCVACHSKLPSDRENPFAERLLERPEIARLPLVERARIQVAVRRFDGALADWETAFGNTAVGPWHFDMNGNLLEYLTVAVRVRGAMDRARGALERMAARDDIPTYLDVHLRGWIASLAELRELAAAPASLRTARELIREANELSIYPQGRDRLIHDLVASHHLNRLIADAPEGDARLAEAYFLLGLIEVRSIDSFWVPQAEVHLTAAIRVDPQGPLARYAYAALEEYLMVGGGGVAAAQAGPTLERLRALRALVEAGPASGP